MQQYLIFCLENQFYAVETSVILQVAPLEQIVEMSNLPDDVKGIMQIKEKFIPIVDTKQRWRKNKFSEKQTDGDIIIMKLNNQEMGWLVDKVKGTIFWSEEDFTPIEWGAQLNPEVQIEKAFVEDQKVIGIVSHHAFQYE